MMLHNMKSNLKNSSVNSEARVPFFVPFPSFPRLSHRLSSFAKEQREPLVFARYCIFTSFVRSPTTKAQNILHTFVRLSPCQRLDSLQVSRIFLGTKKQMFPPGEEEIICVFTSLHFTGPVQSSSPVQYSLWHFVKSRLHCNGVSEVSK